MVFHGGISLKRTLSLKKKKQIAAALAAAVFVCGGCTGNLKEEQDEILLETVAESSENLEHADDAEQSEAGETLPETAEPQETAETRLGSTIYVPGSSASVSDRKSSGKVDLNRADVKELMTLTGIGQSRAEAIIRYREEIGSFERIEDVMKVSGIKESAFNKIKDDITV